MIAHSVRFAGIPRGSWAFGIRIWVAVVTALAASFWLALEAPSTAAVCVAILAAPVRGQALEKACYRMLATIVGVIAALVITALFSQTRDLLLAGFVGWVGLCVYVSGLLDGSRSYAAVLSGYTVALVAIQQTDTPQHVFETGMARGAAIAVGIVAIAVANDLLSAPDNYLQLLSQLSALHGRVREYAKSVLRAEVPAAVAAAGLLRDITALTPELASLAIESASGSIRSVAARDTVVGLIAELHAARVLQAMPAIADPACRDVITSELDRSTDAPFSVSAANWPGEAISGTTRLLSAPLASALDNLLKREQEVREGLAALSAGTRSRRAYRTPLYRSHRIAAHVGIRAAVWLALASVFFVLAGWPAAQAALSLVAVVIGLGAITPNPSGFTLIAFVTALIATALAAILEFVVLDGVTEFPLLAIALAPFVIGATVLTTTPRPLLSALGRLNLIFVLAILAPSNPQTYNPEEFLFTSLFVCVATAALLAAQLLIPPVSTERRRHLLMASAHYELDHVLSRRDRRLAPEEAMFRDAARIGQMIGPADDSPRHRAVLAEALSLFDQAASIRLTYASLGQLTESGLRQVAIGAQQALAARDTRRIRAMARDLQDAAPGEGAAVRATCGALLLAVAMIDAAPYAVEPVTDHV